jgi:hypothetical protein
MTKKLYINSPDFILPSDSFCYSPIMFNHFCVQGERMVNSTIRESSNWSKVFNRWFPLEIQEKSYWESFEKKKLEWQKENPAIILDTERKGKKFYETRRKFTRLVPEAYERTEAPRLSSKGSTFQGMKKDLLLDIIINISLRNKKVVFIDIDMSACHSRIATSLQARPFENTELYRLVHTENFWAGQLDIVQPLIEERGIQVPRVNLKNMLKVFVYTALNGGSPLTPLRMLDTFQNKWPSAVEGIVDPFKFAQTNLYNTFYKAFVNNVLLNSLKDINKSCSANLITYGIDRIKPYYLEADYYGISRVFQSFEVILMCKLAQQIVKTGGIPVSLVHDGILCMYTNEENPKEKIAAIQGEMSEWSKYLLKDIDMPLEAKWSIKEGIML